MKCVLPLALFASTFVSCGREPPTATPALARPLDVPRLDAGPPPTSSQAPARGEVTVSFLTRDGELWGPSYAVAPSPIDLVKPCHARAMASDPSMVGWAMFDLAPGPGSAKVALADASALPKPLLACMETALRRLHVLEGQGLSLPESLVYVTLR